MSTTTDRYEIVFTDEDTCERVYGTTFPAAEARQMSAYRMRWLGPRRSRVGIVATVTDRQTGSVTVHRGREADARRTARREAADR